MSAAIPAEHKGIIENLRNSTRALEVSTLQLYNNYLLSRGDFIKSRFGNLERDIDKECGYPKDITHDMYWQMWERNEMASRVVGIYPEECWVMSPESYETERNRDTSYEVARKKLSDELNVESYLERVDEISGVLEYGCVLLGFDDGKSLETPVEGVFGENSLDRIDGSSNPSRRLLYMRVFDQRNAPIEEIEDDPNSPRNGQPRYYKFKFAKYNKGNIKKPSNTTEDKLVHWSRVLHVADRRICSEIYATPRQKTVWNRLVSLRMLLGGSAEMYWKGAFPGYSFELDPSVAEEDATIDGDKLRKEFQRYSLGLQRYLAIVGLTTKQLAPQVVSPKDHIAEQIRAICIHGGYPMRVFMGSEVGKLASDQDAKRWNGRLAHRNNKYLTPSLLRPFDLRMIEAGVLPKPRKLIYHWPDLNAPTSRERSEVGRKTAEAIMKYLTSGGGQIMAPLDFLTEVLGFSVSHARIIQKNAEKNTVAKTPVGSTGLGQKGGKTK